MVFPLFEAVLKRACANFVTFNGQVITDFTIQTKLGKSKKYTPNGSRNAQCSSLRDLLFLHYTLVASPTLKSLIDRFRDHIIFLAGPDDPFDIIYDWRNQSLHGSTNFSTIGGTILNFTLLISLFELEDNFEQRRLLSLEHCRWEQTSQYKSPWSFYPPY